MKRLLTIVLLCSRVDLARSVCHVGQRWKRLKGTLGPPDVCGLCSVSRLRRATWPYDGASSHPLSPGRAIAVDCCAYTPHRTYICILHWRHWRASNFRGVSGRLDLSFWKVFDRYYRED